MIATRIPVETENVENNIRTSDTNAIEGGTEKFTTKDIRMKKDNRIDVFIDPERK